jgi:hypothetical protein
MESIGAYMKIEYISNEDWDAKYPPNARYEAQCYYDRLKVFSQKVEVNDAVSPVDRSWLRCLLKEFGRYPQDAHNGTHVAYLDKSDMVHVNHIQDVMYRGYR